MPKPLDPAWVTATINRITADCPQCQGQAPKETPPMPSPPIVYHGHTIGARQPWGNTLDKRAFLELKPVDRLRAYLAMVYPRPRRVTLLARVCGLASRDVSNLLEASRQYGWVRRLPGRAGYVLIQQSSTQLRLVAGRKRTARA